MSHIKIKLCSENYSKSNLLPCYTMKTKVTRLNMVFPMGILPLHLPSSQIIFYAFIIELLYSSIKKNLAQYLGIIYQLKTLIFRVAIDCCMSQIVNFVILSIVWGFPLRYLNKWVKVEFFVLLKNHTWKIVSSIKIC